MINIPTWTERCEVHPGHQSGMVTNAMIQMKMQEEIDDLREALSELAEQPTSPSSSRNRRRA